MPGLHSVIDHLTIRSSAAALIVTDPPQCEIIREFNRTGRIGTKFASTDHQPMYEAGKPVADMIRFRWCLISFMTGGTI